MIILIIIIYIMIYVTYGSQSGNSEAIATRIYNDLKARGVTNSKLVVLNSFLTEIQKFPENKGQAYTVVIVCSTTGNGDAPNNADKFIRWIKRKTHTEDTLSNVRFTVLGLGDSNYTKYQYIPRQLDEYFGKLGAKRFFKKGEADDAYGLEMVVEPWVEGLYKEIEALGSSSAEGQEDMKDTGVSKGDLEDNIHVDISKVESYNNAKVIAKKKLSGNKASKEIYSLKIETNSRQFETYAPGANISIVPPNDEQIVNNALSRVCITEKFLVIGKSHNFSIYSEFFEKYPHFQKLLSKSFLTYLEIFKYIIDFNSTLKKLQMENIKKLFKSKLQNTELIQTFELMFSKYTEIVVKNRICLYDIIQNLPTSQLSLSLSEILEYFPIKQPRNYSLVSNSEDNHLEIVFSVVKERITISKEQSGFKKDTFYLGQCTNFLKQLNTGDELFITGISNHFQFPNDNLNQKPIVYICNGTGITPCISYLTGLKNRSNPHTGQMAIFTGFRNASVDKNETIYEDVIIDSLENINHKVGREVIQYFRCLSISSDNEEEEVGIWRNCRINTNYVQDLIIEQEDLVYELLFLKEGYLLICGDVAKLYDEVVNNIIYILGKRNGYPREYALKIIEELKFNNRIVIEKWI
jgi:sulfite reductase alpha subunit-like flavoprotein